MEQCRNYTYHLNPPLVPAFPNLTPHPRRPSQKHKHHLLPPHSPHTETTSHSCCLMPNLSQICPHVPSPLPLQVHVPISPSCNSRQLGLLPLVLLLFLQPILDTAERASFLKCEFNYTFPSPESCSFSSLPRNKIQPPCFLRKRYRCTWTLKKCHTVKLTLWCTALYEFEHMDRF